MATKDSDKKTTKSSTTQSKTDASSEGAVVEKKPWPLVTIGIFATVMLLAIGVFIAWVVITVINPAIRSSIDEYQAAERWSSDERRWSDRDERGGQRSTDTILRGAVVAVTEDSMTISGGGERVTVKLDEDTVIRGDATEIAVDDTVIVAMEENGDTTRADSVIISNESGPTGLFERDRRPVLPNA